MSETKRYLNDQEIVARVRAIARRWCRTEMSDAAAMAEVSALFKTTVRWVDLFGMDPDFTGGQDVNEYLDESRGDA